MNQPQTVTEILQQAAFAAKSMLPALEAEREKIRSRLQEVDLQITRLQSVLSASDGTSEYQVPAFLDKKPHEKVRKAPRGEAESRIDQILLSSGALDTHDLRQELERKFETTYSPSTLYATLQRCAERGKYQYAHGKWAIITEKIKDLI